MSTELPNTLLVPSQQTWVVGVAIPPVFAAIAAVNTFNAPIFYTAANLPKGIALSSGGVFSGTPVLAQQAKPIVVTATDANGLTETQGFEVIIASAPALPIDAIGDPVISYCGPADGFNLAVPGAALTMANPVATAQAITAYLYP